MPLLAPVTSATGTSYRYRAPGQGQEGREVRRVAQVDRLDVGADAPHQADQHAAVAELDEAVDAVVERHAHRLGEAHRAR